MSLLLKSTPEAGLVFIIDGGGSAITTGGKGHLEVPFTCTLQQVSLLADQSGSIKVDIWKDTYGHYPPTNGDSICGGNEPEIAGGRKYQDSALFGWTKLLNKGDILAFNIDSCTTITRAVIGLRVTKR